MTAPIDTATRYKRDPDAMESRLRDETVILHLRSGIYFGLDAVGSVVWERLEAGDTPAGICEAVRGRFANTPDTVEADVTAFMTQLLTHNLITPA